MNNIDTLTRRLTVLGDLVARHPRLPAPHVEIGQVFTDRIALRFHDQPDAFRQWVRALGVDLTTVQGGADDDLAWLILLHEVDGITLKITSYTHPAAVAEKGGAA